MPRCDRCGKECTLPFSCQHCGGSFCADCRLPPVHECAGLQSWKNKPAPGIGLKYGKGGGITVTGGGYISQTRDRAKKKTGPKIPWLKLMMVIIAVVILGVAYLVLISSAR